MTQPGRWDAGDLKLIDLERVQDGHERCRSCGWVTVSENQWRCLNNGCPERDVIEVELMRIKYGRNATTQEIEDLVKKMAIRDGWEEFTPKDCDYTLWSDPNSQSQFGVDGLIIKYGLDTFHRKSLGANNDGN